MMIIPLFVGSALPDVLVSTQTARVGKVRYRLENVFTFLGDSGGVRRCRIVDDRNRVTWLEPHDNESGLAVGKFIAWPFQGELLGVRVGAASSFVTWYYVVNGTGLHGPVMVLDSGWNGGPLYKDVDGDGRKEVFFDNYSYYLDHPKGSLPSRFLVYKVGKAGLPQFWKAIPNPGHIALPDTTGLSSG